MDGRLFGVAMVLTALAGWTITPLLLRHFAESIDPWTSNGWRYGFSALLWSPVLVVGLARRRLPRGIWALAVVPSIFNIAGQVCFTLAHYQIDPGLLTFGLRMQIVCVAIGAAIMFPAERRIIRSPGFLVGGAMVIVGTLATAAGGDLSAPGVVLGVGLAMAAGALFGAYSLAVRKYMHGVHPITAFAAISLYTASAMLLLMVALGRRFGAEPMDVAIMSRPQLGLLLLSAIAGIALGHVAYYFSIAKLGVAVSTGVIQLQPVCVTLVSMAWFGERLTWLQWGTGVLAITGATLMLWVQHRLVARDKREALVEVSPEEYAELPPDHVVAAAAAKGSGEPSRTSM
ncbi:MAG: DMT family transporter [Planctomycetota bacterium]